MPAGAAARGVVTVSFYEPDRGLSATAFWAAEDGGPAAMTARITARRPGPPLLYDPVTGLQSGPAFAEEAGSLTGELPLSTSPLMLIFREGVGAKPPAEGTESLEVSAARPITAEEVIAKYNEFHAAEDERLKNWSSDARINYNFRLGGSVRTVDVGMDAVYFFDPKVGAEWELRDYYLEGLKSKWKEFPEIPFIQPEKVMTLPLDITFDRSYRYEYVGEDTVAGRACHLLAFEPVDPSRTLFRGRVWIDKATWARVKVDSIQTGLEPPFLSSEEKSTYAPVPAQDGQDIWVLVRIDGEQTYSTAGRSLIVLRTVDFKNHRINAGDFAELRQQAYQSDNRMMRDTDKGLRYLERTPDGDRTVKPDFNTSQLFALGGALYDASLAHVYPLAGINYFNYDFMKKGIQTNLFFAGLLASLNVTKPDIGRSGFDLGSDLFLSAIKREDRDFRAGEEVSERNLDRREQSLGINLSREAGDFVHLRTNYELAYQSYDEADSTDPAYILPKDTLLQTISLFGSFHRSGFELRASGSYAVRSDFAFWGDPCQTVPGSAAGAPRFYLSAPPAFCTPAASTAGIADPAKRERERQQLQARKDLLQGDDYDPAAKGFYRYQISGVKELFLPDFQKLRFAAEAYGGQDLDRLSRYTFDRLGTPLAGFSGSGIRFDEGGILRAAYLFDLAKVIRFEARIDQARVRDKADGEGWGNFTGVGLAGSVLGPWKTVWSVEYGYALRSDVRPAQGDQEVFFLVLKLF